jgi:hypothetical protein
MYRYTAEQRFGVKHKDQISALKSSVDVLTLSATPIPRTLHMVGALYSLNSLDPELETAWFRFQPLSL